MARAMAAVPHRVRLLLLLAAQAFLTFAAGYFAGEGYALGNGLNWGMLALVTMAWLGLGLRVWTAFGVAPPTAPTAK